LRSGIDGEEVALAATRVLKEILLSAERKANDHNAAVKALVNAGVIKRTDMSAAQAVIFLRESRANGQVGPSSAERPNLAVVSMICGGMPVGHVDSKSVQTDPGAACELIASCRASAEESSARISALEMFVGCAAAGVRLDADTLLCPEHTGQELLQQAREIVSQATGLPLCVFFGA